MATEKGKSVTDWTSAGDSSTPTVFYRTLNVEGLEIFYREAGRVFIKNEGATILTPIH